MRIKVGGKDIDRNTKVTFESSSSSDAQALTIIGVGFYLIYLIVKGALFS